MINRKSPKPKRCGYSECGEKFIPQRPLQQCCSPKCAIEFNSEKEVKKRFREIENNTTTLSMFEHTAKTVFQKWCRLRDEKEPCISCKRTFTKQWDGGHYYPAGQYSGIIFNEMNVNKQCSECNGTLLHGNPIEYRKGLIQKYGEEKVKELDMLAIEKRNYKYTREELQEITIKYKLKIKHNDFT